MPRADDEGAPFWFAQRQGATAEELATAERYIGYTLPAPLRELLRQQNGGVSNFAAYENGALYYPLLPLFGVDPDAAAGTLMRAFDVRESFGVPAGVVVFAGMGHAWWGLDYRRSAESPTVVYRNSEDEPIQTVALTFEELIEGLVEG